MRKQNKSMLVLAILTAFVAMAVFLPGMTLTVETAEAAPPPPWETPREKVPAPVPKTGQTISYAAGDDGDLQMGVPWPVPRFTDNGDGTVTDNLTRLIWLKNAHHLDLNWDWACYACNILEDDGEELTDGSSPGDWRLPNVRELKSLIDYGQYNPALPAGAPFDNVGSWYWSSSRESSCPDCFSAWYVCLEYGDVAPHDADYPLGVWCVRGGGAKFVPPVLPR